jgi:RNA polymerase sigma-70 factor, ECF subfamily
VEATSSPRGPNHVSLSLERRLVAGDAQAFDAFHSLVHRRLFRYVRARVRQDAEAEEVCQETWIRFLRGVRTFEHRASLWSFLLSVARRTAIDTYRRSSCRPTAGLGEDVALRARRSVASVARTVHHRRVLESTQKRPANITVEAWEALWAHDVDGVSIEEIADQQQIPKGTAGTRVFYARKRLRAALELAGCVPDDSPPTVGCCG